MSSIYKNNISVGFDLSYIAVLKQNSYGHEQVKTTTKPSFQPSRNHTKIPQKINTDFCSSQTNTNKAKLGQNDQRRNKRRPTSKMLPTRLVCPRQPCSVKTRNLRQAQFANVGRLVILEMLVQKIVHGI